MRGAPAFINAMVQITSHRIGKTFTQEGYWSDLTALRDQVKNGLSSTAHEPVMGRGTERF
jgi:hypothetical protein